MRCGRGDGGLCLTGCLLSTLGPGGVQQAGGDGRADSPSAGRAGGA